MDGGNDQSRLQLRKKPKQERSIQRLEAILAAANRLIAEKGIANLKMTEIAAEAGIPIGSLYQFFPEKAAIVRAMHDDLTRRVEGGTRRAFAGVGSIAEAEALVLENIDRFYESFRNDPIYLPVWLTAISDADLQALNKNHLERLSVILIEAFEPLLPGDSRIDLEMRIAQLIYLTGATVRYALVQEDGHARRVLDEWKATVRRTLFVS